MVVSYQHADRHLEQGIALARRIGRPFLELTGPAHWAQLVVVPADDQSIRNREAPVTGLT